MKIRRMFAIVFALVCMAAILSIPAFAAEITEIPSPEGYFGCIIGSYSKSNKTSLEFDMPCIDKSAIEDYIEDVEDICGLELKKTTYIPSEGDYYYALYRGNANCLMLYWDKSYELLTVTVYDNMGCFVSCGSGCDDTSVESPASYFNVNVSREYDSKYDVYTYTMNLGKNGMQYVAKYLCMLKAEYGMTLNDDMTEEEGSEAYYYIENEDGEVCMLINLVYANNSYYACFVFDAALCTPVD